jgi:hypothetical protein
MKRKPTDGAAYATSPIRVKAWTSPPAKEDAKTWPSVGYGTPWQPDAPDLRAAHIRRYFVESADCVIATASNSRAAHLFKLLRGDRCERPPKDQVVNYFDSPGEKEWQAHECRIGD